MTSKSRIPGLLLTTLLMLAASGLMPILGHASNQPHCEEIQHLCGEAGYTRDMPEGKDLMKKCFEPIMQGQTVPGVKADADLVKKCEADEKQNPKHGKHRR